MKEDVQMNYCMDDLCGYVCMGGCYAYTYIMGDLNTEAF